MKDLIERLRGLNAEHPPFGAAHEAADALEQQVELNLQQAAVIEAMRDKLISINEYWNRAHNQIAAVDACYHAIRTAEEALSLQPCPEVLNKVKADAVAKFAKYADDYEVDQLAAEYIQRLLKGEV